MKTQKRFSSGVLALMFALVGVLPLRAEDLAPLYVAQPITDISVDAGAAPTVVKLKKTFGLTGVSGKLVRFSTNVGNIDVGLLKETPQTTARFLSYVNTVEVNGGEAYTYNNTLIQRAVPDFVVQGGGFFVGTQDQINQIVGRPAVPGEPGVKNTRGTLAMALSNGPDSGTGDYFFNVKDNTNLDDASNGGPFTVFGRVVGGMKTLDAIEALPQQNFSSQLGGAFQNVPLIDYDGSQAAGVENLVKVNKVAVLPLLPKGPGKAALLNLKVKSNTNPGLVEVVLSGNKLTLSYVPGQTGSAVITLLAKNKSAKSKLTTSFTVTVR